MKASAQFNYRIPKDFRANLQWRVSAIRRAIEDPGFAEAMRDACLQDPLFFINGWGWTYDPRCQPSPKLPFILYEFQEEAIIDLVSAINDHDILVEKSRDMGASWLCVSAITWAWRFHRDLSFLFVSRVEEYVDKPGNPKAMFWKLDYLLDNLPVWLKPRGYDKAKHRRMLHIENPENNSVVDGESTNSRVARGDRRSAIVLDEFAAVQDGTSVLSSTRDATCCRIFNSTPEGTGNAFYDMRQTEIKKIRLHWSAHPVKSKGLYTTDEKGQIKVIELLGYPECYVPISDGKLRSPWYDNECKRAGSAREIAQELDIDYLGSGGLYFDAAKVQSSIRECCRPFIFIGDLDYDFITGEPKKFREDHSGHLKLWCLLDSNNKPTLRNKVVIGVDVSAGTGASNSCIEIWNEKTLEKIGEYVNPYIRAVDLGMLVYAICKWFEYSADGRKKISPRVIWESGGPGRDFGNKLQELGHGNVVYWKRKGSAGGKQADIAGVPQSNESKTLIMSAYRDAVENIRCINRSKDSLDETLEYIYGPDGFPMHSRSLSKSDPSGAKDNHGDRAMADALAWWEIKENMIEPEKPEQEDIPIGSLAWRNKMREDARNKKQTSWCVLS